VIKKILRIIISVIFSFKYFNNPLVFVSIPFKKNIEIILKNKEKISIKRNHFPLYVELFQKGFYYEKGYYIKNNIKYKMSDQFILLEDFDKNYGIQNLQNKNVLDIGGLNGETALFFVTEKKVKTIFVYEPVKENFELVLKNIKINNFEKNILPYQKGVSNKNGFEIIQSDGKPGTGGFGMPGNKYSIKIPVESWDTILERHNKDNIYLAKVDCEGGERYLVEANKELIKTISNWVIETHSAEIEKNIIGLFESLGYKKELKEEVNKKERVNMWYFYL